MEEKLSSWEGKYKSLTQTNESAQLKIKELESKLFALE